MVRWDLPACVGRPFAFEDDVFLHLARSASRTSLGHGHGRFSGKQPFPKGRSFELNVEGRATLSCFVGPPLRSPPQAEPMVSNGFSKLSRR